MPPWGHCGGELYWARGGLMTHAEQIPQMFLQTTQSSLPVLGAATFTFTGTRAPLPHSMHARPRFFVGDVACAEALLCCRAVVGAVKRAHARALHGGSISQAGDLSGGTRGGRRAPALLLHGPPGTGKTLLCHAVSRQLFPETASVLWLDMAQFASPGAQAQLFGPPPGTVGHAEGGILTRLLRRHRRALVILESIDRAHPDAQGLLASMLRRGTLQDGTRSLDCTHLWLMGTISTGAADAGGGGLAEGGGGGLRDLLRSAMETVVGFEDLRPEVLQQIAQLGLEQLAQRWWVRHGLRLAWSADAVAGVAAGKACMGPDADEGAAGGAGRGGGDQGCGGHAVELALEGIDSCCWACLEREEVCGSMHVSVREGLLRCSASGEGGPSVDAG